MNRHTALVLFFALATLLVPQAARADLGQGLDDLRDAGTVHGIERERDIPLP